MRHVAHHHQGPAAEGGQHPCLGMRQRRPDLACAVDEAAPSHSRPQAASDLSLPLPSGNAGLHRISRSPLAGLAAGHLLGEDGRVQPRRVEQIQVIQLVWRDLVAGGRCASGSRDGWRGGGEVV